MLKPSLIKDKPRITTLDSLRGLAAITVVIAHCTGNINYNPIIDHSPLYFFNAAHEAVIFFFLLSGYVLVYQYESKNKFKYGIFLVLRTCRIYIPYIVSMLFAFGLYALVQPNFIDSSFFGKLWSSPLSAKLITDHVILIGNFDTNSYNPVIWSLVHEMRVAIIFSLLLLITRLRTSIAILAGLFIAALSALLIVLHINTSNGYFNGYLYTSYYFYIFILGGIIVKRQSALLSWFEKLKSWQKTLCIIISLIVYTFSHRVSSILILLRFPALLNFTFCFEDFLTAIAAFLLIIIAIHYSTKRTFLNNKTPLFLGRVFYSLYLIHVPVIAFLYKEFHDKTSIFVILLIGVISSLILSQFFNLYIERASARLGKRLTT